MRIAPATDIHWFHRPGLRHFALKRVVGTANLYLRGRRHEFDERVQQLLVDHLRAQKADLVVISGDLTAQSLPEEFEKAREVLSPLLAEVPSLVVPGNHDVYTPEAASEKFFHRWFGPWSGLGGPLARVDVDLDGGDGGEPERVTALGLDPNRPTWFFASGRVPDDQLEGLAASLADPELADRVVILAIHYPPIGRDGALYDDRSHGLENADALIRVLEQAPKRPALILSGHVHHGFRADITLSDGVRVPVIDCGTSGQRYQPWRGRAASTATYTVTRDGLVSIDRFVHDGERFVSEPGGAFATGR